MILDRGVNSLLNWFPKIKDLGIPVPRTEWVEIPPKLGWRLVVEGKKALDDFNPYLEKIKEKAEEIGYPVFIRTDQASAKHSYENACLVLREEDLLRAIRNTLEFNINADLLGLPFKAIVIREFLELYWGFKAFHGNLPIAKERRYFIKDRKVLCHHPYWPPEAIEQAHSLDGSKPYNRYLIHRLPAMWREILEELNRETLEEVALLTNYSEQVAQVIEGYWSIDYALSRDGKTWYLIDMANGYQSYHDPKCRYAELSDGKRRP